MKWPEKIICHGEGERSWLGPEDRVDERGWPRIKPWRTCSFCGSIHPEDLYRLTVENSFRAFCDVCSLNPEELRDWSESPHLELADLKYGNPHKIYVDGLPRLHTNRRFQIGSTPKWDVKSGRYVQVPLMDSQLGYVARAKFYTAHLSDGEFDEEAWGALTKAILDFAGVQFTRDGGQLSWKIQRPS